MIETDQTYRLPVPQNKSSSVNSSHLSPRFKDCFRADAIIKAVAPTAMPPASFSICEFSAAMSGFFSGFFAAGRALRVELDILLRNLQNLNGNLVAAKWGSKISHLP